MAGSCSIEAGVLRIQKLWGPFYPSAFVGKKLLWDNHDCYHCIVEMILRMRKEEEITMTATKIKMVMSMIIVME